MLAKRQNITCLIEPDLFPTASRVPLAADPSEEARPGSARLLNCLPAGVSHISEVIPDILKNLNKRGRNNA